MAFKPTPWFNSEEAIGILANEVIKLEHQSKADATFKDRIRADGIRFAKAHSWKEVGRRYVEWFKRVYPKRNTAADATTAAAHLTITDLAASIKQPPSLLGRLSIDTLKEDIVCNNKSVFIKVDIEAPHNRNHSNTIRGILAISLGSCIKKQICRFFASKKIEVAIDCSDTRSTLSLDSSKRKISYQGKIRQMIFEVYKMVILSIRRDDIFTLSLTLKVDKEFEIYYVDSKIILARLFIDKDNVERYESYRYIY